MYISRSINGIPFDVDISQGNSVFFEEDVARQIIGGDLSQIEEIFYDAAGKFTPLAMTWEITNHCNFHCPFCYINIDDFQRKHVNFSEVKQDIDYLIDSGLFICYLTGGEILTHPYFIDIYTYLKEHGVLVALLTNLSLLTNDHISLFEKYKPYKITVSLYGISGKQFSQATGQKKTPAETVLNNVLKLKIHNINVKCQTPINKLTFHEYSLLAEWCNNNNIAYSADDELRSDYAMNSKSEYAIDHNVFKTEKCRINHTIDVQPEDAPTFSRISKKYHFDCMSGRYYFVFSYNNRIRPCFVFSGEGSNSFSVSEGMQKAMSDMIEYLNRWKKKTIDYCSGCEAVEICNECIYTQSLHDDVKKYMAAKCNENYLKMLRIKKDGIQSLISDTVGK